MVTKKTVEDAATAVQDKLDGLITSNQKAMQDAIKELETRIVKMVGELKTGSTGNLLGPKTNLKQAQAIHKDLVKLFEEKFNRPVRKNVKGWREVADWIEQNLADLDEAAEFTGIDRVLIKQLEEQAILSFVDISNQARDKVANAMYRSIAAQSPFDYLVNEIAGALVGLEDAKGRPLSQYAELYANDGIMNFYNALHVALGRAAGLKYYLYVGNVMSTTRDFCRQRVGKVFSAAEINSWTFDWAGKSGPAMTNRGGYNCRHHWQPVDPEWFE